MVYCLYSYKPEDLRRDMSVILRKIPVAGKANVANKNLVTPRGAVTKVTDEEYEILKNDHTFNDHVKRGYITVEKKEFSVDKIIKNMKPKDESAPLTPESYDKSPLGAPRPIA